LNRDAGAITVRPRVSPVVPVAAIDPVQAMELAARATEWLTTVLRQRRSKDERGAAVFLREVGVLAASAHALNNAGRVVTAPLLHYRDDWSREEQQQVFEDLDAFLRDSFILPELERALAATTLALRMVEDGTMHADSEVKKTLDPLWRVLAEGQDMTRVMLSETSVADNYLSALWAELTRAQHSAEPLRASAEAVERLVDLGRDVRGIVPRLWLSEVDTLLGNLRSAVAIRHPQLPTPEWLLGVSTAA
jgi:hypothetical protein